MKKFQSMFTVKETPKEPPKDENCSSFTQPRPPMPAPNRLHTQTTLDPQTKLIVEYNDDFKEKLKKSQINETKAIMVENQNKIRERGAKLEDLGVKVQKMNKLSQNYLENCKKIREKEESNKKMSVYYTKMEENNGENYDKFQEKNSHYREHLFKIEDVQFDEETEKKLRNKDERLIENVHRKNQFSVFNCCG